ncbi:MAG: hypothetical protein LBL52_04130 [Rickettsiales bacterium]|jgi:UTP-glucose-1-phosphate uridylyltransferase|nr:hypothetical protein [Rickettsiales bacterium]
MDEIFAGPIKGHGLKGLISRIWYSIKRRIINPENIYNRKIDASNLEFVILAAGKSTRNYPHSKGLPHKSLVPFGSRKVIDEVMRQIIVAGGKHITIVVSDDSVITAFEACFKREPEIENKFMRKGDTTRLELLQSLYIPEDVEIKYVVQRQPLGTGHATAVAYEPIRESGRNVVMIWPDDIFVADRFAKYPEDRVPMYRRAVARYVLEGGRGNMAITRYVKDPSRWGVISKGYYVEKPVDMVSHEAVNGFFIFDKEVCEELLSEAKRAEAGEKIEGLIGGEHTFIPALNRIIEKNPRKMKVRTVQMKDSDIYLDCGSIEGYEKALIYTLLAESRFARDNFKFIKLILPRVENNIRREEGAK